MIMFIRAHKLKHNCRSAYACHQIAIRLSSTNPPVQAVEETELVSPPQDEPQHVFAAASITSLHKTAIPIFPQVAKVLDRHHNHGRGKRDKELLCSFQVLDNILGIQVDHNHDIRLSVTLVFVGNHICKYIFFYPSPYSKKGFCRGARLVTRRTLDLSCSI